MFSDADPPVACRNGHPFGPNRVHLGWSLCSCDRTGSGGHRTWRCRACDDVQFADGHTDHGMLASANPGPSPFRSPLI